ncbi:MAG: hemerythrin domain-containing protein [Terriglobia bacterium]
MTELPKPTAILNHEHLAIKSVLTTILKIAEAVEKYRLVDQSLLADVTTFLQTFTVQCQQAQEEELLFPLLAAKCVTPSACFIAGLAWEHRRAQFLASDLVENISGYVLGGGAHPERLVTSLRDLAVLYQQHLWKEEHILLPMADRLLSTADQKALLEAFGRLTSEVELADLAAGIELQLAHPPSHLGQILI